MALPSSKSPLLLPALLAAALLLLIALEDTMGILELDCGALETLLATLDEGTTVTDDTACELLDAGVLVGKLDTAMALLEAGALLTTLCEEKLLELAPGGSVATHPASASAVAPVSKRLNIVAPP